MTFNPVGGYDLYEIVVSEDARVRERRIGHIRALKESEHALEDGERHQGFVSWIMARMAPRRLVVGAQPATRHDAHELTDYICRLADGTMGQVAIRQSDDEWAGVCVAV